MSEKLKMVSFRFSPEDLRKLDFLCEHKKASWPGGFWPVRINRTSVVQNLISLAYIEATEAEAKVTSTVERAKKRLKKAAKAS